MVSIQGVPRGFIQKPIKISPEIIRVYHKSIFILLD